MRKLIYTCLSILLLITGCVKHHPVSQPPPDYPDPVYFKAEGSGQSDAEARDQALAEMSKVFEAKVFSDTYDRTVELIGVTGNDVYRGKMESDIRVTSSVKLEGARIGRIWFDSEKGSYRALAVLDRRQAGENWQGEIKEIDGKIEGEFISLDSLNSKFMKLRSLMKIMDHWVEREVIVSRLRVIGFKDAGARSYDIKRVFYMVPQIKTDMRVFLKIAGEHGSEMEGALSGELNRAGFILSDERSRADVLIIGSVDAGPVELNNPGWKFARATVSLTIIDAATGMSVGEISDNARAGHQTYAEAAHKAVKKITASASGRLLEYFE